MKKHKVGFIGTGKRSLSYARAYRESEEIEIAALADTERRNRGVFAREAGLTDGMAEFDDWHDMLAEITDLDGVVIGTPNFLHAEQAIACLERGLPIALEKPLATNKHDCERIVAAEARNGGRVLLGFVLRSTPFYLKIHELIASGAIGELVSIQADELPGVGVTSIMNRGTWRRHARTSGGSLLEKSCHDMDIINWMMGCRPLSLSSYGANLIFKPDASLPDTCGNCPRRKECKYFKEPSLPGQGKGAGQFIREERRCIYNIDKDVMDVQNVCLQYENGAVANFLLNFNCMGPRADRNFHAIGKRGRIWGNFSEGKVGAYSNLSGATSEYDTGGDGSGHGGGDRQHALLLRRMMRDPGFKPEQNAAAGYLSAAMCFAADQSRIRRKRIDFRYEDDGRISSD